MTKPKDPQEKEKTDSKKIGTEVNDRKGQQQTDRDSKQEGKERKQTEQKQMDGKQTGAGPDAEEGLTVEPTAEDKLAAEKEKYLRLAAEYDNFRKRTAKERDFIYSNAKADVIAKLLPVYDNLERAAKMECADEAYFKGIEMIMLQLTELLGDMGVIAIPTVGEPFDPNRHSAVLRIENPDMGEGIIAEECQKGFTMGERIIRFSSVVVAN